MRVAVAMFICISLPILIALLIGWAYKGDDDE